MLDLTTADIKTFGVWWLGQSGFLLYYQGSWLCFDPYLSDSLTRKYANTEKPHVRMFPIVADAASLNFVDVATSTHNHTDHLDAETLNGMRPKDLVIPEANRAFVANRLGCDSAWPVGMAVGESRQVGSFVFHCVPAAHERLSPECVGYVVEFGPYRVYHSGDTLLYEGMAERIRPFGVHAAFLPINGKVGNMNHREAAWLGIEIEARLVIPCHYDMFEFNTANPQDFAQEAGKLGLRYQIMQLGGRFVY